MAKRFTDTEKYKKRFFRGLPGAYKLLWDYLYHSCDHAGIWIVDFEIAQIYLGKDMQVNYEEAVNHFNSDKKRVIELDEKTKWFLPKFVEFQYGLLNPKNNAHNSVINILRKYKLVKNEQGANEGLIRVSCDPIDKDKEKDKDKSKDKDKDYTEKFMHLWDDYPNTNGSKSQTFKNYNSCRKKFKWSDDQIYTACMNSLQKQIDEGKAPEYYYQLSNVLGKNYSNDLPELLNYKPVVKNDVPCSQEVSDILGAM
jgi:hypothetical protein